MAIITRSACRQNKRDGDQTGYVEFKPGEFKTSWSDIILVSMFIVPVVMFILLVIGCIWGIRKDRMLKKAGARAKPRDEESGIVYLGKPELSADDKRIPAVIIYELEQPGLPEMDGQEVHEIHGDFEKEIDGNMRHEIYGREIEAEIEGDAKLKGLG